MSFLQCRKAWPCKRVLLVWYLMVVVMLKIFYFKIFSAHTRYPVIVICFFFCLPHLHKSLRMTCERHLLVTFGILFLFTPGKKKINAFLIHFVQTKNFPESITSFVIFFFKVCTNLWRRLYIKYIIKIFSVIYQIKVIFLRFLNYWTNCNNFYKKNCWPRKNKFQPW